VRTVSLGKGGTEWYTRCRISFKDVELEDYRVTHPKGPNAQKKPHQTGGNARSGRTPNSKVSAAFSALKGEDELRCVISSWSTEKKAVPISIGELERQVSRDVPASHAVRIQSPQTAGIAPGNR